MVNHHEYPINLSKLLTMPKPMQSAWRNIASTFRRIQLGIRDAYRRDGGIFRNERDPLPAKDDGYYREFVAWPPGQVGAGLQRLIGGEDGEWYYSPDHYKDFYGIKS